MEYRLSEGAVLRMDPDDILTLAVRWPDGTWNPYSEYKDWAEGTPIAPEKAAQLTKGTQQDDGQHAPKAE